MYIFENNLCFWSLTGYKAIKIPMVDINFITKEKMIGLLNTRIKIQYEIEDRKKNFLIASITSRDEIFEALEKSWKKSNN